MSDTNKDQNLNNSNITSTVNSSNNANHNPNKSRSSFKGFFSILGILAILGSAFGGYLYFNNNLSEGLSNNGNNNGKTALAANVPSTAFNPSDCGTYLANGGSSNNGVCYVKMYEKGGILYKNLDIAPGELVNVRNYYNNTTTASVTAANIADSIPASFTKVGTVTNNYVDAAPVTLNNNVFTGQNLSVAPGAGYFGYAGDNSLTSSNLELGKKRYLDYLYCRQDYTAGGDYDVVTFNRILDISNTNSTPLLPSPDCAPANQNGSGYTPNLFGDNSISKFLITGNKNIQFQICRQDRTVNDLDSVMFSAIVDINNNSTRAVDNPACTPSVQNLQGYTPAPNNSVATYNTLGQRYIHDIICRQDRTIDGNIDSLTIPSIIVSNNSTESIPSPSCSPSVQNASGYTPSSTNTVNSFDTSDTTRGYGYISYTMQTPTSGLTNGQTFGTTGTLNAGGAKTSDKSGTLTIINANSANVVSGIIPNDCNTYPGTAAKTTNGDGQACTAKTYVKNGVEYNAMEVAPGETVTVRLRYNTSSSASADQIRLKDNIPTGWTLSGNASSKYVDSSPLNLGAAGSLFNIPGGPAGLDLAPHIGFFGATASTPATDAVSTLELGKKRYMHILVCSPNIAQDIYISRVSFKNSSTFLPQTCGSGFSFTGVQVVPSPGASSSANGSAGNPVYVDLLGQRYLHVLSCSPMSDQDLFLRQITAKNNTTSIGSNCGGGNYSAGGLSTLTLAQPTGGNPVYEDLLGKKNFFMLQCTPTASQDFFIRRFEFTNTAAISNTDCGGANYSSNGIGATGDGNSENPFGGSVNDQTRGYGYLEYQMTSPSNLGTGTVAGNPSVILEDANDNNWTTANNPTGNATLIGVTTPAPNMNYTKLYSVDGGSTWSPTVSASTGQPIKVRLWNENTGGLSVTNGNIKDALPVGFNYTAGSAKNCLNPSTILPTTPDNTELICDTGNTANKDLLFSTLTSTGGISPSAGLFDAAGTSVASGGTAFNAVAGAKEIGRERYLYNNICLNSANSDFRFDSVTTGNSATQPIITCDPSYVSFPIFGTHGVTDSLGKRYLYNNICVNSTNSDFRFDSITTGNTSTQPVITCDPSYVSFPIFGTHGVIDTLDASRSKSYIEYEMSASSSVTTGNYGTISSINSTATTPEFSSINSGSPNDITITADPAFNIKKLLALPTSGTGSSAVCPTDTTSYTPTLSGVDAGATVCVRLAYQNKTSGAVSNTLITDSQIDGYLPPDFARTGLVANSTINCLTPTSGSPICNTDAGQGGAIPDTVWALPVGLVDASSPLNITPHAGLYGIPSNQRTGGTMEMGKKRFANFRECSYRKPNVDTVLDRYLMSLSNIPITTFDCTTIIPSGYVNNTTGDGSNEQAILSNRYLHMRSCSYASSTITDTNLDQLTFLDNTANATWDCVAGIASQNLNPPYDLIGNGGTDGALDNDTLTKRYIHIRQCSYTNNTNGDTFLDRRIIAVDNIATNTYDCNSSPLSGYTIGNAGGISAYSYDLLDPTNGAGYIQYKMTASPSSTSSTLTLPNVTLSGDSQTTVTSNATINFNATPLTETDIAGLTVTCPTSPVNSTTTCTFTLPSNKTLPTDFKLSIGSGTPGGTCTATGSSVSCVSVPTGNSVGNIPIYGNLGTGGTATKTPTGENVTITGINFGNISWIFNPDQGGTSPLFRSSDNTSITVKNFRTSTDLTPSSNTRYTCTFEYRAYGDRLDTTATWRALNTTPIAYTTGSGATAGCTANLTKTQRANALNHSLRLTITDSQSIDFPVCNPGDTCVLDGPNTTYLFYNEYIYRFQGAGTASGG